MSTVPRPYATIRRMKLQFSLATLLVCIPMQFAVAVAFRWQIDMRRQSKIVFTVTLLALALFSSSHAEAQDTSTKRDDPTVILEGKVIDDQVVDERGKLIAGAIIIARTIQNREVRRDSIKSLRLPMAASGSRASRYPLFSWQPRRMDGRQASREWPQTNRT